MTDSRSVAVLAGAAILVLALFAPWYALDLGGAARHALDQRTGQIPGGFGELARGLLAALPDRIVVSGWEALEKTDIVLLCCGLAAAFAALLARLDVAAVAGSVAAGATVLAMLDKPGHAGGLITLQWGPWVALGGAVTIIVAARTRGHAKPDSASQEWSGPVAVAPLPELREAPASIAPPVPPAA